MSSRYDVIQANVLRVLEPAALGDRTSRIWDLSLFFLVVLNLVAVALESVPTLQMSYGKWLYNFELFSVVVFSVEYVLGLVKTLVGIVRILMVNPYQYAFPKDQQRNLV